MKRLRRAPDWLWDALLSAALAALVVGDLIGLDDPDVITGAALAAIAALPLVRRRWPLGTVVAWSALAVFLFVVADAPDTLAVPFVGLLIFPYTAARVDGPRGLVALPAVWAATSANAIASSDWVWGDIFFPGMFGTLFWLAGKAVRSRSRLTAELHEAAVRADEDREIVAAQAVADERRRIAREMHDVVAHSVSVMVVQAGGARRILARDPERAVEAAALIERTGREALVEMRHLLGVLHAEDGHAPEFEPQPTLAQLDALVARTRAAGVPVEMRVEGEKRELPAGVDLAAYRVVQEALTNVIKHGGGAATEVLVRYGDDAVELSIADRGDGTLHAGLASSGSGLLGMRERVRVCGGELEAGRRTGGGFAVRARLPLQDEEEAALAVGVRA